MPASSKRAKRVEKRNQYRKQTGQIKKAHKGAKRQAKFDTKNEPDNVVRDLGNRKRFHVSDMCAMQPKTLNQERFLTHFYDGVPIISLLGSAGSGKSFLALYAAMSQVFDPATPYQKIILIRPPVQEVNIGFLPGGLDGPDSKLSPFEAPYKAIISDILPKFNDGYDHMKSLGYIEFHCLSFLRSHTFNDAIVVVSECQNADYSSLKTVISRCGANTRIILEGDTAQEDMSRNRQKTGLPHLENVLYNMPPSDYVGIKFTHDDIVRSQLVKNFLIADELTK